MPLPSEIKCKRANSRRRRNKFAKKGNQQTNKNKQLKKQINFSTPSVEGYGICAAVGATLTPGFEVGGIGPPKSIDIGELVSQLCRQLTKNMGGDVQKCLEANHINLAQYVEGMCTIAQEGAEHIEEKLLDYREFLDKSFACVDVFGPHLLNFSSGDTDNGCASCQCQVGCTKISPGS